MVEAKNEVVERKVLKKKKTQPRGTLIFGGFVYNKQGCYKKQGRKFCKGNYKRKIEQGENALEIITWK